MPYKNADDRRARARWRTANRVRPPRYCGCGSEIPKFKRACLECRRATVRASYRALLAASPGYAARQAANGRAKAKRRKAAVRGLPATLTAAGWLDTLAAFGNRCAYCDAVLTAVDQDHVVPVKSGGGYTKENIVPACPKCNNSKNSKELRSWLQDEDRYQFVCDMRSSAPVQFAGGGGKP